MIHRLKPVQEFEVDILLLQRIVTTCYLYYTRFMDRVPSKTLQTLKKKKV